MCVRDEEEFDDEPDELDEEPPEEDPVEPDEEPPDEEPPEEDPEEDPGMRRRWPMRIMPLAFRLFAEMILATVVP